MYEELKKILDGGKRMVFFGGAGVSTESGVPDFRSANGLYNAKTNYGRSPEEMLSIDFFEEDPVTFYDYYKKNLIATWAKPNKAHLALARLEADGKLAAVVTQNIDGLHQAAGSKRVYELHGSVHRNRCRWCGKQFPLDYVLDEANCREGVPYCECGGMIKPEVVLYGEMLDDDCIRGAVNAIREADVLIIGGTSLAVYPAAGFVNYFSGDHLVVINKSEVNVRGADLVINDPIGEVLGACVLSGEAGA
ncbi:MAG: NAD-dependent protein deacylase [Oscillospiraceae bacterium]|nr:NAD-dependent protein deacylase [Oscillospiraceae bacterium]